MSASPPRRRPGVVWAVATAAFFLMGAGWALALPANGTYDESQHVIRAYAAASGQLYGHPDAHLGGASFDVPRSLLPDNANCTWKGARRPATCQHRPATDRTRVLTNTAAGRYNPVYYALVGLPEVISPSFAGIVGARLLSAFLSAVLLGAAAAIAWTRGERLLLGAIVLATTPMALNLAGSVNPNGLEISAGVLCWTALLVLLRGTTAADGRGDRLLLWCAGVSAALLLTLRTLGPLFLLMTVVGAWALARPGRVRKLRSSRLLLALLALVAVYAVGWTLLSGQLGVTPSTTGSADSAVRTIRLIVARRADFWTEQVVGVFSYGETLLPRWVYPVWYALGGALVVPAVLLARRWDAVALVSIGGAAVAVLTVLEVHYRGVLGFSQHGRYVMPFAVGMLLGAALVVPWQQALGPAGGRLPLLIALVTAPLQIYALGAVMTRFERGVAALWQPFGGGWHPPLGTVAPMAAEALGVLGLLLVVLTCRASDGAAPARLGELAGVRGAT